VELAVPARSSVRRLSPPIADYEGTSCEFGLYDPAVNNEDRYATCSRRRVDRLAGLEGPKLKPLPQGFLSRLVLRQADEVGELLLCP
jgi:hypothetical protein